MLYSEEVTSEHRLAKIDFMTSTTGELNGIRLTLSTYGDSGMVRLSEAVPLNIIGGSGNGIKSIWFQYGDEHVKTLVISYTEK